MEENKYDVIVDTGVTEKKRYSAVEKAKIVLARANIVENKKVLLQAELAEAVEPIIQLAQESNDKDVQKFANAIAQKLNKIL